MGLDYTDPTAKTNTYMSLFGLFCYLFGINRSIERNRGMWALYSCLFLLTRDESSSISATM